MRTMYFQVKILYSSQGGVNHHRYTSDQTSIPNTVSGNLNQVVSAYMART